MLTLQEYLDREQRDFDTYDERYGICVTVTHSSKVEDDYDMFCRGICNKVLVTKEAVEDGYICKVDWAALIRRNYNAFQEFAQRNWKKQYKGKDAFVKAWIMELHAYMAGEVPESFYTALAEFVNGLERCIALRVRPKRKPDAVPTKPVKEQEGSFDEYLELVQKDGLALQGYSRQTFDLCLVAVQQNGMALEYVKVPNKKLYVEAVRQTEKAYRLIENPSRELQKRLVQVNYKVLGEMEHPEKWLVLEALRWNPKAMDFCLMQKKLKTLVEGVKT